MVDTTGSKYQRVWIGNQIMQNITNCPYQRNEPPHFDNDVTGRVELFNSTFSHTCKIWYWFSWYNLTCNKTFLKDVFPNLKPTLLGRHLPRIPTVQVLIELEQVLLIDCIPHSAGVLNSVSHSELSSAREQKQVFSFGFWSPQWPYSLDSRLM